MRAVDRLIARVRISGEQRDGSEHLSWRAETALYGVVLDERRLERVQPAAGREPFDRRDRVAVVCERRASGRRRWARAARRRPCEQHGAGSAFAALAGRLGAGQMKLITKDRQQRRVWRRRQQSVGGR